MIALFLLAVVAAAGVPTGPISFTNGYACDAPAVQYSNTNDTEYSGSVVFNCNGNVVNTVSATYDTNGSTATYTFTNTWAPVTSGFKSSIAIPASSPCVASKDGVSWTCGTVTASLKANPDNSQGVFTFTSTDGSAIPDGLLNYVAGSAGGQR